MHRAALWITLTLALAACSGSPDPSALKIHGVNFVGVSVTDINRSSAFYAGATDLDSVVLDEAGNAVAMAKLADPGVALLEERLLRTSNAQLRLMQFTSPSADSPRIGPTPVHGPGIAHVCFQVNKETRAYDRFLESGATHIGAREMVGLSSRNPVEYAYAHDPDGIMFEVEHVDVAALDLETPPANDYRIRHVSLATPDMDAALAFYSKLLGGQKPRRVGRFFSISGDKVDLVSGMPGSKLKMSWFQIRNLELEIVQYVSHPTERPAEPRPVDAVGYNMIVFDVRDLDEARSVLLDAGGTLVTEAMAMDGGEILFGRDPDGNLLGFQVAKADAVVSSQNFKNNGL